jgi:hypothetical protein
VRQFTL